jgi:hypothetical protein
MTTTAFVLATVTALTGAAIGYYRGFLNGSWYGCLAPRRLRKRARLVAGQLVQAETE